MSIETRVRAWLDRRFHERLLIRFGGIQTCPWCRQCAQAGDGLWEFRAWERDPFLDVLTCSVCGGTSLWRFEVGMIYIGPLASPTPKRAAVDYYDIPTASLGQRVKAILETNHG